MSNTKTVWITGCKGFIGSELAKRLEAYGYRIAGTDAELSVCEPERLNAFCNEVRPDVIINCAGIPRAATGLSNRIHAYEVNALGARNVAVVANAYDALMVQISTDDVFPLRMAEPANEFDAPNPETPYGKSKRAGEVMVRDTNPASLIVRGCWVYDIHGGMLKDALDAARTGTKLKAQTDQTNSPTSITTYVKFLVKAIEQQASGVLHIADKGNVSRYDFLSKALELCGYQPADVLVPTTNIVTSEQVLLESMMLQIVGEELPEWQDDLRAYLSEVDLRYTGCQQN